MATFSNHLGRPQAGDAFDFLGFATLFRGIALLRQTLVARRAERAERLQIARELATYSDRDLGELGFSRADLPMIADGTYRR